MAKFKVGDRVRITDEGVESGVWMDAVLDKVGTVTEISEIPNVEFDNGEIDWGREDYLELVEEPNKYDSTPKTETQRLTVNVNIGAELTHITIGGKRFRLVAED